MEPEQSAGAAMWAKVTSDYELRPDELRVLRDACCEIDLIDAMQAELNRGELVVDGSMGQPRISPLVSELRQHRAVLKSLLGSLNLPDESAGKVNQNRAAGMATWAAKRGA